MKELKEIFKAYKEFDNKSKLFIAKMYQEKKESKNDRKLFQRT